ncbi:unnamed protein product [Enterobius vermicularis]|uniref:Beta-lactamase domain-containing protein n=1 Tax=Enterobius vermicularis TaxID=51028 RepID=A0A0N4V3A3_ENTVE|nr:unnamed protein product [Enterobius vermicularis]
MTKVVEKIFIIGRILKHEKEGLAVAVYKDNELVVDLWGGYAERSALRPWEEDTLTFGFSTTKFTAALIVAILVTQGRMKYEDKVTKYWSEFGRNGKEDITIQCIVEHKAGLIKFDGELELKDGNNYNLISKLIEDTRPVWPPGTKVGYHVLTYGWLIDQIVRRVDVKNRGVVDFFKEEIYPLAADKDYFIGLPRSEHYRLARLVQPSRREILRAFIHNPIYVKSGIMNIFQSCRCYGLLDVAGNYPPWLSTVKSELPYNNPKVQQIENLSVSGFGTARGFASVVSAILQNNLISQEVWEVLQKPTELVTDSVAKVRCYRGYGFFYDVHPTKEKAFLLSHTGFGGQKIIVDPYSKTVVVLFRNAIEWDLRKEKLTDNIMKKVLLLDGGS